MSSPAQTTNSNDPISGKFPFFYGWAMLPIAVAGQIATCPGQTYGVTSFNDSFKMDLHLNGDSELSGAYMIATLLASLPIPFVGVLMDYYGIRRTMTVVVALLGLACIGVSQVTGIVGLFFAFLMLRLLGQGALSLLSSNTLALWFHDRLGTASGIMAASTAIAIALIPGLHVYLIQEQGWRWTYAAMGIAVWVVMLPLLAIFFRNRPEDIGQLPDGYSKEESHEFQSNGITHQQWTLREATRTSSYWIILFLEALWALVATAIVFHVFTIFQSRGLDKRNVASFFLFFGLSMAMMQIFGGLLADKLRATFLISVSMAIMTGALMLLLVVENNNEAYLFAVLFGSGQGLFNVLKQTVWARYYGRTHLGRIRGTVWTGCVAGSSVGPFIMGVTKDISGNYLISIWLFLIVYAIGTIAALFASPPIKKTDIA